MCPLLKLMSDPEATGAAASPSVSCGGEVGGVIPARARSVLRRDSASYKRVVVAQGEWGEETYRDEGAVCILRLLSLRCGFITTDTFDVIESIGMIRFVMCDVKFTHRGRGEGVRRPTSNHL